MKSINKIIYLKFICLFLWIANTHAQTRESLQDTLLSRQSAIVRIAAQAARGDQEKLAVGLEKGLEDGLSVNEIKEILVQLYAYAGFPRSLNAISTFEKVLKGRQEKGIKDEAGMLPAKVDFGPSRYEYGKGNQAKLTGASANSTQAFVPIIDTFLKEHLFGAIFGRNNLDYRSREIATISIIATIGNAEAQLRSHLRNGHHNGLSEGQLREIGGLLAQQVGPETGASAEILIDGMFPHPGGKAMIKSTPLPPGSTFGTGTLVNNNNFTGKVWVRGISLSNQADPPGLGNVTFSPMARSNWHSHSLGQILMVTDGVGYYQEKGEAPRLIRKGDIISCPPNKPHWHGASHNSAMSHIAIGPSGGQGKVEWMAKVSDTEYDLILQQKK